MNKTPWIQFIKKRKNLIFFDQFSPESFLLRHEGVFDGNQLYFWHHHNHLLSPIPFFVNYPTRTNSKQTNSEKNKKNSEKNVKSVFHQNEQIDPSKFPKEFQNVKKIVFDRNNFIKHSNELKELPPNTELSFHMNHFERPLSRTHSKSLNLLTKKSSKIKPSSNPRESKFISPTMKLTSEATSEINFETISEANSKANPETKLNPEAISEANFAAKPEASLEGIFEPNSSSKSKLNPDKISEPNSEANFEACFEAKSGANFAANSEANFFSKSNAEAISEPSISNLTSSVQRLTLSGPTTYDLNQLTPSNSVKTRFHVFSRTLRTSPLINRPSSLIDSKFNNVSNIGEIGNRREENREDDALSFRPMLNDLSFFPERENFSNLSTPRLFLLTLHEKGLMMLREYDAIISNKHNFLNDFDINHNTKLLVACMRNNMNLIGLGIFIRMKKLNFDLNLITYSAAIKCCCTANPDIHKTIIELINNDEKNDYFDTNIVNYDKEIDKRSGNDQKRLSNDGNGKEKVNEKSNLGEFDLVRSTESIDSNYKNDQKNLKFFQNLDNIENFGYVSKSGDVLPQNDKNDETNYGKFSAIQFIDCLITDLLNNKKSIENIENILKKFDNVNENVYKLVAMEILNEMRSKKVKPNQKTYVPLIKFFTKWKDYASLHHIKLLMVEDGLYCTKYKLSKFYLSDFLNENSRKNGDETFSNPSFLKKINNNLSKSIEEIHDDKIFKNFFIFLAQEKNFFVAEKTLLLLHKKNDLIQQRLFWPKSTIYFFLTTFLKIVNENLDIDDCGKNFSEKVLKKMNMSIDLRLYNTFIQFFTKKGKVNEAVNCLEEMKNNNISPCEYSFAPLLIQCSRYYMIDEAFEIMRVMKKLNLTPSSIHYSSLIHACVNSQRLDKAYEVLEEMKKTKIKRIGFHYHPILSYLCRKGRIMDAIDLFRSMQEDFTPSVVSFSILVHGCALAKNKEMGLKLYEELKERKIEMNYFFHSAMVELYFKTNDMDSAFNFLNELKEKGEEFHPRVYGALIFGLVKNNRLNDAIDLYNQVKVKSSQTLPAYAINSILYSLGESGRLKECVSIFHETKDTNKWGDIHPKLIMDSLYWNATSVFLSFIKNNQINMALDFIQQLKNDKFSNELIFFDMIFLTFSTAHKKVNGVNFFGVKDAIFVVKFMKKMGLTPSRIGYESILDGCALMADVDSACAIIRDMAKQNLPPTVFTLFRLFQSAVESEDEEIACLALEKIFAQFRVDKNFMVMILTSLKPFYLASIQKRRKRQQDDYLSHGDYGEKDGTSLNESNHAGHLEEEEEEEEGEEEDATLPRVRRMVNEWRAKYFGNGMMKMNEIHIDVDDVDDGNICDVVKEEMGMDWWKEEWLNDKGEIDLDVNNDDDDDDDGGGDDDDGKHEQFK